MGVGPEVGVGADDVDGAGGDEGDEHVLVDGELVFLVIILFEVFAEPVGVGDVGVAGGFAEAAAEEGGAAAAGVVGDDEGEAFILGAGPERGLAEAGLAHDGDAGVVDVIIGLKVVEGAAQAPGPGADGSPLVGGGSGLTGFVV